MTPGIFWSRNGENKSCFLPSHMMLTVWRVGALGLERSITSQVRNCTYRKIVKGNIHETKKTYNKGDLPKQERLQVPAEHGG